MDNTYVLGPNGELYHWGIKGMKWGVRRYQNKDGSLTPAGKKRYDDSEGEKATPAKRKSAKDMTDEELGRAIARARAEDEYNRLRPEKPSGSEKKPSFAKRFMEDAIKPALINSGRKAMESAMDKVIKDILKDKVDPDSIDALKKFKEKLELKRDIRILKEGKKESDMTIDERTKEYDLAQKKKKDAAEADARKAAMEEYERFQRDYEQYGEPSVRNSTGPREYSKSGGETTYVHPNVSNPPAIYNSPVTSLSTNIVSNGAGKAKDYFDYAIVDKNGNEIRRYTSDDDVFLRRDD